MIMEDVPMPTLSYDNTVPYEEQTHPDEPQRGLADRIGSARLYLLSDTTKASKRKRDDTSPTQVDLDNEEALDDAGLPYRPNALLISGPPVSSLPTARVFAYATHYDARPLGLEWVDDTSCVLVFDNALSAKICYRRLVKDEDQVDSEGFVTAQPIPMALWSPEDRINQTLGKSDGSAKGVIKMRYARNEDVKKKNARQESNFYKRHGDFAGKEMYGREREDEGHDTKRRRREDDALSKAALDAELDNFLADEDQDPEFLQVDEDTADNSTPGTTRSTSPVSKMRSDYIAHDGRTLLERTSIIRSHGEGDTRLLERLTDARPPSSSRRTSDERRSHGDQRRSRGDGGRSHGDERRSRTDGGRVRKTQQELDDELDAFLNARD
ncbi:hypothetical protein BDV98DRAFT_549950 [Pterulicium gracile]|uniref:Chromatin target of PRMT1 protein C-terminal domain-containing protein n=1 Tax=Pterulicium gracile TaxID=1884261 RepID=A0A5C3QGK2_9AGAR|nr:hypothetical protein BDV98DRAFT_549950 [Pterula gracilis]